VSPSSENPRLPDDARRRRAKTWLLRAGKALILVLVIWFIRRTLVDAWGQLFDDSDPAKHRVWQFHWEWLLAAGAIYVAALLPAGFFWYRALRALGQEARLAETLRAYFIGHLGKYVPGKAMVVILRVGLISGHRVHAGIAAASVFLETLTWIAVASFLAAACLAVQLRGHAWFLAGALGLLVAATLPTIPPIFVRLAKWARVGRSDPVVAAHLHNLRWPTLLLGWGLMAAGWLLMGLCYWATLQAMGVNVGAPWEHLPWLVASVALATVLGFLAVFIPAGMGVREAALAELMIPYLDTFPAFRQDAAAVAVLSAVLLRLVSLVSELTVSGILYGLGFRGNRQDAMPDAPTEGLPQSTLASASETPADASRP
jgi:uncharacterized membrane protein YbhN (UPF0104 family)